MGKLVLDTAVVDAIQHERAARDIEDRRTQLGVILGYTNDGDTIALYFIVKNELDHIELPFESPSGIAVVAHVVSRRCDSPAKHALLTLEASSGDTTSWRTFSAASAQPATLDIRYDDDPAAVHNSTSRRPLVNAFYATHRLYRMRMVSRLVYAGQSAMKEALDRCVAAVDATGGAVSVADGAAVLCGSDRSTDVTTDTLVEFVGRQGAKRGPTTRSAKKGAKGSKGAKTRLVHEVLDREAEFELPDRPDVPIELCPLQPCSTENVLSPVVEYSERDVTEVALATDVLMYAKRNAPLSEVDAELREATKRQLEKVVKIYSLSRGARPRCPYHFSHPSFLPFAVTLLLRPDAEEDSPQDTEWRRGLHRALSLPQDRPLFRRACAGLGAPAHRSPSGAKRLQNVHLGATFPRGSAPSNAKPQVIQGDYDYFHYMQDKFDDNGWGCAYRSLQTIISWCVRQKYASCAVPTHTEVQKVLVDMDDKPPSFVGSKEWIGANEVCYVLEHFTNVSSRIMHVSRGSEMESKGRELATHFATQGTPVMIGGGVLAYTLLGVRFDEKTGSTLFLILDPHYIGAEDLGTIQARGWCGWKTSDLFVKNAFYNLCMPIRPKLV